MKCTIRCDKESINVDGPSHQFKWKNSVYVRVYNPSRGNRLNYETGTNRLGELWRQPSPYLRGEERNDSTCGR
ncbi:hypothetical protein GQ43DRAFT_492490 [Delitschia confertaspora ATCC 74209]|uniref:DUF8032 domain-containing protein n=1 Tax=Delitschia confertaspora ATCC 74209 TaxID=1513339 RepID=A0A9P4MW19_9PLEO|nr:hypothetical protein GQ43DRAFT_492490 [Delitschia confertaspora ATCC 74209]